MTISFQVTIWCDKCSNWDQISDTAAGARKQLKQQGWKTNVKTDDGRKDYCPKCNKK